jgi:hypothetical protein
LLINEGEPNEQTLSIEFTLVDPCAENELVTISFTKPSDWATEMWITDAETFALDPATELSYATTPPVVDPNACGPYTVVFTVDDN